MKMSTNWGSSYGFNGLSGFRGLGTTAMERPSLWALVDIAGSAVDGVTREMNTAATLGADAELLAGWRASAVRIEARLNDAMMLIDTDAAASAELEVELRGAAMQAQALQALITRGIAAAPGALATRVGLWTGFGVLAAVGAVLGVAYYASRRKRRRRR